MSDDDAPTQETIELALAIHTRAGRLLGWSYDEHGWYLQLNRRPADLHLTTLREVHLLIAGLASAGYAPSPNQEPTP